MRCALLCARSVDAWCAKYTQDPSCLKCRACNSSGAACPGGVQNNYGPALQKTRDPKWAKFAINLTDPCLPIGEHAHLQTMRLAACVLAPTALRCRQRDRSQQLLLERTDARERDRGRVPTRRSGGADRCVGRALRSQHPRRQLHSHASRPMHGVRCGAANDQRRLRGAWELGRRDEIHLERRAVFALCARTPHDALDTTADSLTRAASLLIQIATRAALGKSWKVIRLEACQTSFTRARAAPRGAAYRR